MQVQWGYRVISYGPIFRKEAEAMINWKVRIRNKNFWIAIIPTLILLLRAILALFGVTIDLSDVSGKIVDVIELVFTALAIIGVVNDPTTEGLGDSYRALGYDKPYEKV